MTVTYVSQTFTAANGSAPANLILGRNPNVGGGVTVQSNRVDFATGTTGSYSPNDRVSRRVSVDGTTALSVADVDVTLTLNIGSGESFPELILRCSQSAWDGQTGYAVQLNSGVFRLFRALNYSYTTLASTTWVYGTGSDVTVRFRASGPTLQAWVGTTTGTPTFSVTDTAIPNAGFVVFNVAGGSAASASHVFVDNLVVTDGATTSTTPPTPPTAGTTTPVPPDGFVVEVDWERDGTYQDHTTDVRPMLGPISAQYGRDQSTALAPSVSGSASVTLSNQTGKFSPRNPSSPLYGKLKPGRPVRITRTVAGNTYTVFAGQTDDQPLTPDMDSKTVGLSLLDPLAVLKGTEISTRVFSGIRTGDAIGYVLDAAGWPIEKRELDPGATYIQWWWEEGTDALTALDRLVQSEGQPALLTVSSNGAVVFRDRHHRLTRDVSQTVQSTWRSTGSLEPVMQTGFTYDEAWRNIVNTANVTVDSRMPGPQQPIWTSESSISLAAGEIRTINISGSDPFINAVAPVAGVDYTAVTGSITARLVRDSGASTALVITGSATPARIDGLQVRANPLSVVNSVLVGASDPDSIDEYGARSFPVDLPWCNRYDAAAVTGLTVSQRAAPLPIVTARFVIGRNATKAAALLSRDLSDRVHVVEPNTWTDDDFFIESVQHLLTGPHDHEVIFGLECVPPSVEPVFTFDTAGQGFNQGLFGTGADDPANIFRFDGAVGHRFNEGVFAT